MQDQLPPARRSHKKLVDYTTHRRNGMPPLVIQEAALRNEEQLSSSLPEGSFGSLLSHKSSAMSDEPIDFLLKIPSMRRRQSSNLSREQLLVECDKRVGLFEKEERNRRLSLERRNSPRVEARRSSLIGAILSRDLLDEDSKNDTACRRRSARSLFGDADRSRSLPILGGGDKIN